MEEELILVIYILYEHLHKQKKLYIRHDECVNAQI